MDQRRASRRARRPHVYVAADVSGAVTALLRSVPRSRRRGPEQRRARAPWIARPGDARADVAAIRRARGPRAMPGGVRRAGDRRFVRRFAVLAGRPASRAPPPALRRGYAAGGSAHAAVTEVAPTRRCAACASTLRAPSAERGVIRAPSRGRALPDAPSTWRDSQPTSSIERGLGLGRSGKILSCQHRLRRPLASAVRLRVARALGFHVPSSARSNAGDSRRPGGPPAAHPASATLRRLGWALRRLMSSLLRVPTAQQWPDPAAQVAAPACVSI